MSKTRIEWTEQTWNPIISGCSIISEGCTNCYAMTMARRLEAMGQEKYKGLTRKTAKGKTIWNGKKNIDMIDKALYEPLKRKQPTMYFVNSMTDLFQKGVPFEAIDKIMAVIALTPQHTYQVLTKREDRMYEYFSQSRQLNFEINNILDLYPAKGSKFELYEIAEKFIKNPTILPNLWLGVSVENKESLPRIDKLREIPAAVRFISFEPLLQDLGTINLNGIDWVIVGGESGQGDIRPMHPDWVRSIKDQCQNAGVPFFFKQWGEYIPVEKRGEYWYTVSGNTYTSAYLSEQIQFSDTLYFAKVGKKQSGALLDGKEYREMPK